jgi:hypothetical protein
MQTVVGTKQLDAIHPRLREIMGTNPPTITASRLCSAAFLTGITAQQLEELFELALDSAFFDGQEIASQEEEPEED